MESTATTRRPEVQNIANRLPPFNPLTPNDHYSGRTAPLTFKVAFIYLFNKYRY